MKNRTPGTPCPRMPKRKEIATKKRLAKRESRRDFVYEIITLDNYRCQNPWCVSIHKSARTPAGRVDQNSVSHLTVHEIMKRGRGGGEYPANCITYCLSCHRITEEGWKPKTVWVTPVEFEIAVLEWHKEHHPESFRWEIVMLYLYRLRDKQAI